MMRTVCGGVLLVTLLGGGFVGAAARGEAGRPAEQEVAGVKKHPRYQEFYKAKNVVVAKLEGVRAGPVAESFPPMYTFDLKLKVEKVLRGTLKVGDQVSCSYAEHGQDPPKLPVGKKCLVVLRAEGTMAAVLEDASGELLRVAEAATGEAVKAEAATETLAREHPTEHPLYQPFKNAEGAVVVRQDEEGSASMGSQGDSTRSLVCVVSVRSGMKVGDRFEAAFPPTVAADGELPDARFWIVGYKLAGGKYEGSVVAEASETNLRVLAAATNTPVRTIKELERVRLPRVKRVERPDDSGSTSGYDPGSAGR